jgi:hypothetical protein
MGARVLELNWSRLRSQSLALLGVIDFGRRAGGQRREHQRRGRAHDERTDPQCEVAAAHERGVCRMGEQ